MLCCVVAGFFIVRFVVKWPSVAKYLGFSFKDANEFGWDEYCDLDRFAS
ncbi:MAG: hypothetical protein LBM98_05880 [Oscillospiraceae bacterium]|jgi:hypothetical protein|nr:hypothetical protein [Oscillospiraceae bacterium]